MGRVDNISEANAFTFRRDPKDRDRMYLRMPLEGKFSVGV
jgi:hypothetical protein